MNKSKSYLRTLAYDIRISGKSRIVYTSLWNKTQKTISEITNWCALNNYLLRDTGNLNPVQMALNKFS